MIISITSRRRPWSRLALALLTVAGLATLVLVGWLGERSGGAPPAANAPVAQPAPPDRWIQPGVPGAHQASDGALRMGETGEEGPVRIGTVKPFRLDASGALVLDADTVVTLEQLVALSTPEQFTALAREAAAALPALQQAQALELAQRFDRYQEAVRQRVQPDQAPLTVDDMARDLQALQVMRHEHFGAQPALQLFGDQEAIAARLIELMTQDTQADAPLQERALRAQARLLAERNGQTDGRGGGG
jgi:hypothetical protein